MAASLNVVMIDKACDFRSWHLADVVGCRIDVCCRGVSKADMPLKPSRFR